MHHNKINDPRYLNICPEQIGYKPIELQEILKYKDETIKNKS